MILNTILIIARHEEKSSVFTKEFIMNAIHFAEHRISIGRAVRAKRLTMFLLGRRTMSAKWMFARAGYCPFSSSAFFCNFFDNYLLWKEDLRLSCQSKEFERGRFFHIPSLGSPNRFSTPSSHISTVLSSSANPELNEIRFEVLCLHD